MDNKFYEFPRADFSNIIWLVEDNNTIPYCKKHKVPLIDANPDVLMMGSSWGYTGDTLMCPNDSANFPLQLKINHEKDYVKGLINREKLKDYKIVRIDPDGTQVISKEKQSLNTDFWVETKLSDTSKGLELMIQVGKKDEGGNKVQLFVDLPAQRLGFDSSVKDKHPAGLFGEITATFKDSQTKIISK